MRKKRSMQLITVKPMGAMGRVVIPAEVRHKLGLEPGAGVGVYTDGAGIVLRPLTRAGHCPVCGSPLSEAGEGVR